MHFNCIIFIQFAVGYIASGVAGEPQDALVNQYLDLVNVYFEYKHVSILTQFTCFSMGESSIQCVEPKIFRIFCNCCALLIISLSCEIQPRMCSSVQNYQMNHFNCDTLIISIECHR